MKNILYQESIVEIKHLFRMMRNTLLALFVFAGTAFATESYSQTMKVTVVADNMSTGKVISEIEKQTDYLFVYNVNEVNLKRNVKVNAQNKSVAEVLNKVFEGTDIYYAMEGKNITRVQPIASAGQACSQRRLRTPLCAGQENERAGPVNGEPCSAAAAAALLRLCSEEIFSSLVSVYHVVQKSASMLRLKIHGEFNKL